MPAPTVVASQPRSLDLDRLTGMLGLPDVAWRHDVSASLEAAVEMAELERALGVRATYYVMPRSPFYNPFAHEGRRDIERIVELGHDLAVHVDLDVPRDAELSAGYVERACEEDARLLMSAAVGCSVRRAVSFHCAPRALLWRKVAGFASAYAPQWEGRYRSDSSGAFAQGDPEDYDGPRPLQVSLHPEHWFSVDGRDYESFWR